MPSSSSIGEHHIYDAQSGRMPRVTNEDLSTLFSRFREVQKTVGELQDMHPVPVRTLVVPQSHAVGLLRSFEAVSMFSNAAACHMIRHEVANKPTQFAKVADLLHKADQNLRKAYALLEALEKDNPVQRSMNAPLEGRTFVLPGVFADIPDTRLVKISSAQIDAHRLIKYLQVATFHQAEDRMGGQRIPDSA